jgi:hypothetical protein
MSDFDISHTLLLGNVMTTPRLKSFLLILTLAIASVAASTASAQIPQTINYQGYLTNSGGHQVNAAVNVTFRL